MTRGVSPWRPALRIARRDALRHRSRSLLVIAMIGLPVAALGFADSAYRTMQQTPALQARTDLGPSASAWVSAPGKNALIQGPPSNSGVDVRGPLRAKPATLQVLVPNVVESALMRFRGGDGSVSVTSAAATTAGTMSVSALELNYALPVARGLLRSVSGRPPRSLHEVAISRELATTLAVRVGARIDISGRRYLVTAVVLPYYYRDALVVGLPGAFPQVSFASASNSMQPPYGVGWLVVTKTPVTYRDVLRMNALGSLVESSYLASHSPAPCSPEVPRQVRGCYPGTGMNSQRAQAIALIGLAAGMGLLQVVIMVGPAFAIGRRRQAAALALVAAVGGDARAVRRTVLASGIVFGLVGGVLGVALGVALFYLLTPLVSNLAQRDVSVVVVGWEIVALPVVALLTGVAAAWLPARAAAKQNVIDSLAGRRGQVGSTRTVTLVGLGLFALGAAALIVTATGSQPGLLLLGCVLAELGLVALAPALVVAAARLAPALPAAPRVALRDAGRNRLRAGTAAAAVLAAVAGATAVATYLTSVDSNGARHYVPPVPAGLVYLSPETGAGLSRVPNIAAVQQALQATSVHELRGLPANESPIAKCGPGTCTRDWYAVPPKGVSTSCGPGMNFSLWPCVQSFGGPWSGFIVGGAAIYRDVTGAPMPLKFQADLARGMALVSADLVHFRDKGGRITFANYKTHHTVSLATVPASGLTREQSSRFALLVAPETAKAVGFKVSVLGITMQAHAPLDSAHLATATSLANSTAIPLQLWAGSPYQSVPDAPLLLLLAAVAALAVLASGVSAGLANADARPDFGTMAAVGATPLTRRIVAGASAAVVAVIGTGLGALAGLLVGMAAVNSAHDPYQTVFSSFAEAAHLPLSVPWLRLGVLWLSIPLVAVSLVVVLTRSRLPMVRRFD